MSSPDGGSNFSSRMWPDPGATTAGWVMSTHTSFPERHGASHRTVPPSTFPAHPSDLCALTHKNRVALATLTQNLNVSRTSRPRAVILTPPPLERRRDTNAKAAAKERKQPIGRTTRFAIESRERGRICWRLPVRFARSESAPRLSLQVHVRSPSCFEAPAASRGVSVPFRSGNPAGVSGVPRSLAERGIAIPVSGAAVPPDVRDSGRHPADAGIGIDGARGRGMAKSRRDLMHIKKDRR